MSLKIFYGSRIEDLAKKLKECLLIDRQGKDPFVFTKVVVPNGNLAKWLQIRMFAKEPDLCAGIQFPFMEKELTELMKAGLPKDERAEVELLPDHAYAKAIVSILLAGPEEQEEEQEEYAKLAPFRKYLMNSDSADAVEVTDNNNIWYRNEQSNNADMAFDVHWCLQKIFDRFGFSPSRSTRSESQHSVNASGSA